MAAVSRAWCSGCSRAFISVRAFDAHRSHHGSHGSCVNPEVFGLVQDGEVWRFPVDDTRLIATR